MKTKRTRRVFDPKENNGRTVDLDRAKELSQVCSEMKISWALIDRWQNQAMEGMLTALSPKRQKDPKQLNPRLIQLIDKKLDSGTLVKLEKRLKRIQKKAN
jgi:transposase